MKEAAAELYAENTLFRRLTPLGFLQTRQAAINKQSGGKVGAFPGRKGRW